MAESNTGSLPPLPWSYQTNEPPHGGSGFVYLLDAKGRKIASLWGNFAEKTAMAELICDAADAALARAKALGGE